MEIKSEFLTASIDHKHLALKIGDDRALVGALRVLFPCDYIGEPIRGYRGTNYRKTRRVHGFSRMRDIEVARRFARDRARPQFGSVGVALVAVAQSEAILLFPEKSETYDEEEVVLDPYPTRRVKIIERYTKGMTTKLET